MLAVTRENTRHFHGFRVARTETAKAFVAQVIDRLLAWEAEHYPRTRRRKDADLRQFHAQVEALVTDLIHRELTCPGEFIAVTLHSLDAADRYRAPVLTDSIRHVLTLLEEAGFIGVVKGNNRDGWRSSVSTALWWTVDLPGIGLDDLGEAPQEVIYLRGARQWTDPQKTGKKPEKRRAENLQYRDTAQTRAWRQTMQSINDWLAIAHIEVESGAVNDEGTEIDVNQRALYRVFTDKWTQGGRMYGAFWVNMPKAERFRSIRIGGKRPVEVDYKQAHPTMLYGEAGVPIPTDSYAIPGIPLDCREDVKALFNAMLNARSELNRYPTGIKPIAGLSCTKAVARIKDYHAPIASAFQTGKGLQLQRKESDIVIDVLLALRGKGIVALPIHDALLVAEGTEDIASQVMQEVFRDRLGFDAKVELRYS